MQPYNKIVVGQEVWDSMAPAQKQLINEQNRKAAQDYLTKLMSEAGLFPAAQERLRKIFAGTEMNGARQAVKIEKRLQEKETDEYHREHAPEYLAAAGVKLEDLATGGVQ